MFARFSVLGQLPGFWFRTNVPKVSHFSSSKAATVTEGSVGQKRYSLVEDGSGPAVTAVGLTPAVVVAPTCWGMLQEPPPDMKVAKTPYSLVALEGVVVPVARPEEPALM